jgi:acyl dehydratase
MTSTVSLTVAAGAGRMPRCLIVELLGLVLVRAAVHRHGSDPSPRSTSMPPITVTGADEVRALTGRHLGHSDWVEVTQQRVQRFAEATGDFQWIHVEVERARAESPFGGPIAHGYLTLSLIPLLLPQIVSFEGFSMGVNYGADRVRFPSPVPVGAKVRAGAALEEVTDVAGGIQVRLAITIETEGSGKPACVAEVLLRSYL